MNKSLLTRARKLIRNRTITAAPVEIIVRYADDPPLTDSVQRRIVFNMPGNRSIPQPDPKT